MSIGKISEYQGYSIGPSFTLRVFAEVYGEKYFQFSLTSSSRAELEFYARGHGIELQ